MTKQHAPQCLVCKHWISPFDRDDPDADEAEPTQVCTAFPLPGGIPDQIWHNQADHRQPFDGDQGVQFEPRAGEQFPEFALEPAPSGGDDGLA